MSAELQERILSIVSQVQLMPSLFDYIEAVSTK
jgi:hypothetical protein